jgi:hypothetical protein
MKLRCSPTVALAAALAFVLAAAPALAQAPLPVLAPSNVVLPNYVAQAPGITAGFEGGAAVARGDDALATWYNPAGLSRVKQSSLVASGGAIQWLHVTPNAFPTNVASAGMLPVQLGFLWREPFDYMGWTMAVSFSTENNWDHELSAELQTGTPSSPEKYSYAASSTYLRRTASVGAGYSPDEKLRLGGSADLVLTQLHAAQSINDRIVRSQSAPTALVTSYNRTRFVHLRLTAGAQYDVGERVKVGGTVRTPGIMLANNATAGFDATVDAGDLSRNFSYYDEHPEMTLKLPFEFVGGVAYMTERGAVEGDVRVVQGSGVYDFLVPSKPLITVTDSGASVAQVESAFPTLQVDSEAVVDILVGGRYRVSETGKLTVHGGFATANSGVGDTDDVFKKVNLTRISAGVSGSTEHLTFAGGFSYQSGTSGIYPVFTSQVGEAVNTTIDVSGFAFLYSVAVRF